MLSDGDADFCTAVPLWCESAWCFMLSRGNELCCLLSYNSLVTLNSGTVLAAMA